MVDYEFYQGDSHKDKTKSILERIKSNMNQGQFKKLMKDDEVRAFFELYGGRRR